ncbi:zinc carboxypeptidase-like [Euwallacea similis]|uniref:zinc carboxypeptidase-like n=1 Tax=Euwallacea similis TaxID=1736056 RepID=UPI00344F0443
MKLLVSLFLALLFYMTAAKLSYRNYKVYKITPNNEAALKELQEWDTEAMEFSKYQFWRGATKVGSEATLMAAPEMQIYFERSLAIMNVDVSIMMEDVQQVIDLENRWARVSEPNPVNWTVYNTLDEINNWLEELAVEFSEKVEILKPGKSQEGRDIVGLKLDFSPNVEKQVVFMEFNIHAREWITSATATWLLDRYLRSEELDVRALAEKYTWYFFPVMNPDGFVYSHEFDRMWRKTRTRYNIHCWGADPNRNWGYQWMNGGASQNPCSDIYAGPEPFSEPSVKVMSQFIESIQKNMVAYLDFHSYSQMLLLPFGHTTEHLANYKDMKEIAEVAMNKLESVHGTQYVIGNVAETIYIATGSSMDWVKGEFNTSIAYTYELRDKGTYGFILPAEQIIPNSEETLKSILEIFKQYEARYPEQNIIGKN